MQRLTILILLALAAATTAQEGQIDFELHDGDRVVFLGNSFFERALDYGVIETSLALHWPQRKITFRNLGWDGDTVFGHSRTGGRRRSVFGDPEEGFQRMIEQVHSLKSSVVFLAYGFNESFAGEDGLDAFRQGVTRLLGEISSDKTRIVILTPTPMEAGFGPDQSAVAKRNAVLKQYQGVLVEIATSSKHPLVDLSGLVRDSGQPYSENGIHPSAAGYQEIARQIGKQLNLPPPTL
ncbi:MAG: lysophospholipase L1-like esterase, partial [Verrucomicrobiales bacterium]